MRSSIPWRFVSWSPSYSGKALEIRTKGDWLLLGGEATLSSFSTLHAGRSILVVGIHLGLAVDMPVYTIYLLSLNKPLDTVISTLRKLSLKPLVTAKVVCWIITPSRLSEKHLVHPLQPWDILLILPGPLGSLPVELKPLIKDIWSIQAGIPAKLVASFESTNDRLLHPSAREVPPLTGALIHPKVVHSSQALELGDELWQWISSGKGPKGAVSMLNLLAFEPCKKDAYLTYGKAFAKFIGSSRGGLAKIVGKVIPGSCSDECDEWEEVHASMINIKFTSDKKC